MTKSWDSRLARALVRPLVHTSVHPNHLTTLSLLVGLSGAVSFGLGSSLSIALGAGLYMLSMFLDHTDGELARLSGKTSEFGHRYDRAVDLVVKSAVFAGMGVGVARATGTSEPIWMGLVCGAAFVAIFVGHDQINARTRMGIPEQTGLRRLRDRRHSLSDRPDHLAGGAGRIFMDREPRGPGLRRYRLDPILASAGARSLI